MDAACEVREFGASPAKTNLRFVSSSRRDKSMRVAHLSVYALAGVALVGWVEAQAAVCVTKNKKGVIKKVTIRQACAKKETAVQASDLLQQGPHVLDSGGTEVGALVSEG